jgi:hypothetical protein
MPNYQCRHPTLSFETHQEQVLKSTNGQSRRTLTKDVFKTDINGRFTMRRERHPGLTRNIPRSPILISLDIPNLHQSIQLEYTSILTR